jgi:Dual oxidase maturation factor
LQVLIGVRVGLSGTNFSVAVERPEEGHTYFWDQRLEFDSLQGMRNQMQNSLRLGMPDEVLQLQEQMAGCGVMFEQPGFMWPFRLRQAGYYSSWILAAVLVAWVVNFLAFFSRTTYAHDVTKYKILNYFATNIVLL